MIIKKRDSKEADIKELEALLSLPLPENKRFLVERELRFVKSGDRGESDSAYFIDFVYSESKNWAVLHALRLEYDGKVAQIDHLMINRMFDFYVLETKNYSYIIKITETGEFLVQHNNKYLAIESPIEQNKRHIYLLEKILNKREIMPTRLGFRISPFFNNYVLVSTKSRVVRPSKDKFDTSMVIKSDTLETTIMKNVDDKSTLSVLAAGSKMVATEKLREVAERIAKLHRPIKIDYRKRFGIDASTPTQPIISQPESTEPKKNFYCIKCKKRITEKVAKFCWDNKKRFGGRAYCFDCQKSFSTKE